MSQPWRSPYQTQSYYNGLVAAGEQVEILETQNANIYFDGTSGTLTAWELDTSTTLTPEQLRGRVAFRLAEAEDTASPPEECSTSYSTLALYKEAPRFSRRFMRNVAKAQQYHPKAQLSIAETRSQVSQALNVFVEYPDRRDGLAIDRFTQRARSLIASGSMLLYSLTEEDEMLGTVCALMSDTQANLRNYSAQHNGNAGHLLHHLTIEDLFINQSVDIVDLSGVSPNSESEKMRGIDEFKRQIGGNIVRFEQL